MAASRLAAFERFSAASLPTEAAEEWRYSRIDALDLDRYAPASPVAAEAPGGLADVLGPLAPSVVVHTSNGQMAGSPAPCPGVEIVDLSRLAERPDAAPGSVSGEPDALVTLNHAFARCPLVVRVTRTPPQRRPVLIVHWAGGEGKAVFPRTFVEVGPGVEVSVVEVTASADVAALIVPVTELVVSDGAICGYVNLQLLGPRVWQVGLQASQVGRDASLTSAAVALGGDYARLRTDSSLIGQGGATRLLAAFFGAGSQMHDFRTTQDHRAARTTSNLLYKGVVANTARSVYTGLIRVEKGAGGTNAYQTNRNLVLHEGAHADSVPNLEIEDNDVRCSHASAVGPIDDDQRFYLESRGVPPSVADRLIALGFWDEVLSVVPTPAVVPPLRARLADKLSRAEAGEAP